MSLSVDVAVFAAVVVSLTPTFIHMRMSYFVIWPFASYKSRLFAALFVDKAYFVEFIMSN